MGDAVEAIVGLGSNLGDRESYLLKALDLLDEMDQTRLLRVSPIYETSAVGPSATPFLNAAAAIETSLPPERLLATLHEIEKGCGRIRHPGRQWGEERTLDLDLLLYGNETLSGSHLVLPHPGLTERDFALRPLLDVSPEAVNPATGLPFASLIEKTCYKTIKSPPLPLPSQLDYTLLEHTADVGIEARAGTLRELLETCAMSLVDLIVPRERLREQERYDVSVKGDDIGQIVVALLQEVIYLFDCQGFLPLRVRVRPPAAQPWTEVEAAFFGRVVSRENVRTAVKAATYHMLQVQKASSKPEQWTARVYFDV